MHTDIHTSTRETADLLRLATDAAIRAGEAIMEVYESPETDWEVERKADNSPLTLADRRSHDVIAPALEATGIPVLSEEGAHLPYEERREWKTLWIVDPLDGTKEFLKRNDEFTVNIALVVDGTPVMGVIYVPAKRNLYVGSEAGAFKVKLGKGKYNIDDLKLKPIVPKDEDSEGPLVVVASRSHLSDETKAYIDCLRKEYPSVRKVSAGSSIKLCLVAEGKANVYPRFAPTMEWDTAAGHAICRAAGCDVYAVGQGDPTPLRYNKADLHNPWFVVG